MQDTTHDESHIIVYKLVLRVISLRIRNVDVFYQKSASLII